MNIINIIFLIAFIGFFITQIISATLNTIIFVKRRKERKNEHN